MQLTNHIAFKEWAVVCAALGSGRQVTILRKGGIDEGEEGFRVRHREFWLLPTRFHQDAAGLVPDAEPLWRETQQCQPAAGKIRIDLYAVVEEVFEVRNLKTLEKLAGQHILSSATIEQRFHYRQPGLFVLAVRIYRSTQKYEIEDNAYVAGCKSWVELPNAYSTANAKAVMDDATFTERMSSMRAIIGS